MPEAALPERGAAGRPARIPLTFTISNPNAS